MKHLLCVLFLCPFLVFSQATYQQAEADFNQEKFSKAKPFFENYLKVNPQHLKTIEYLGDIAGYQKDWDTAIKFYKVLVEKKESNANYHFKYGGAMGMKALSISKFRAVTYISDIKYHFEKAARLDPSHIEARWALVEFYIQLPGIIGGSEEKALEYATELEKLSAVDGYLAKGYVAEYSKRLADAEYYYKKAIDVGGSLTTYEKLTAYYEKNNKHKEAIDTISKSFQVHKRNQLNYQIGKIAAQYNLQPSLGINSLEAYLKNYSVKDGVPKNWAYYRLAQIYKNEGKKEVALQWINKALKDNPDFKEAKNEKQQILSL